MKVGGYNIMKQPSSQGVVKSTFVLLFMETRSSNDGGCGNVNGGGGGGS